MKIELGRDFGPDVSSFWVGFVGESHPRRRIELVGHLGWERLGLLHLYSVVWAKFCCRRRTAAAVVDLSSPAVGTWGQKSFFRLVARKQDFLKEIQSCILLCICNVLSDNELLMVCLESFRRPFESI